MQNKHQHSLGQQQKAYQQLNLTKSERFRLITRREDRAHRVHARHGHRGLCRGLYHGHGRRDHHDLHDRAPRKERLL